MECESRPYSIISIDQNRFFNFNINYKVISLMFSNKKVIINKKPCENGVVVITTAQLHSKKLKLSFSAGPNPACRMSEICKGENL